MNSLQLDNGGRPVANDDFLTLQNRDSLLGLPALLTSLMPCIVSGCQVFKTGSIYNVAAGIVWDGVNLLDFPGQSNVTLPAMFAPSVPVVVDDRAYQDGTTKPTITSQRMELVAVVAGAPNLVIDTYGALTFMHRLQEQLRSAKQVEWVAGLVPTNYDADGLGKPGTEAWGWALADGQGGRADLRERFVAGYNPANPDYAIGATGGAANVALDISQIPNHSHGLGLSYGQSNNGQSTTNVRTDSRRDGALGSTAATGGGQAHENRPPYYVLAARQWVGY